MNISSIQSVQNVYTNNSSNSNNSVEPSNVEQETKSDSISISMKALELSKNDENSFDGSGTVDKNESDLDRALLLFKEVGFEDYIRIMKTVNYIKNALSKTAENFPAFKETLKSIEESFDKQLPMSVSEAMDRLNESLKDTPKELRDAVMRHLKNEIKRDETLSEDDSNLILKLV